MKNKSLKLKVYFVVLFCITAVLISAVLNKEPNIEKVLPGEIGLKARAVHPFWRTEAFPSNTEADVNPPSFYWPSERREFTEPLKEYDFQLSKDFSFSVVEEEIRKRNPSFYVANKALSEGKWFWRYRESGGDWIGPYKFTIGTGTRTDKRPATDLFVKSVNVERPRVVIRKERLVKARKLFEFKGLTKSIILKTEKYFGVQLPAMEWGGKFYKDGKRIFKNNKFPDNHIKSKITAPIWTDAIENLCMAYLLTEKKKYAEEALRWGMRVVKFDLLTPNKLTYDGNPVPDGFAFAMYLNCMSYIYDCLYEVMDDKQRIEIRNNLKERLKIYYEYYSNRLENRCFDNHAWQISIAAFVRGAITAKGDIPEADKYLSYAYDIWTAIDPEQSRTDGGWFGGGYVAVNIDVWTEVASYFRAYTGYNYYNHPYYKNHPYYFLYRQAPGSVGDGFSGDGYGGNSRYLGAKLKLWMRLLDEDLDLPIARYIADGNLGKKGKKFNDFALFRQSEGMQLNSRKEVIVPKNIKQSRDFRDIGVVNMHSDLLNPKNDLHVALRSSPYGNFGHNLASHNAFNIIYKGDYLFTPYGHRHGGAKNSVACYRHTRGHNSVLIDGKGQPFSPQAYGWIPRFLDGEKITYACGDASNAYNAEPFGRENLFFERAQLKKEDHISNGVLNRFRRHVVFLRPSLIVVYDELEAKKPVKWDWVLHSRFDMKAKDASLSIEGVNATVDVRGSIPMTAKVKEKPMFMPINVDGRGGVEPGSEYPINGTHAYVSSSYKTDKIRLLTFIQVGDVNKLKQVSKGVYQCGDWNIKGVMDSRKMANLKISNTDNTASFLLKSTRTGASVIKEMINGKISEVKGVDELPFHAKGLEQVSNIITEN